VAGLNGWARLAHSWLTERWYRRNSLFVLAIGGNGPPWFRRAGYPEARIFPFAYFIPEPCKRSSEARDDVLRVAFLGRLIEEKGVRELAQACAGLSFPYELVYIGNDSAADWLKQLCARLSVDACFTGAKPISEIGCLLAGIDILILASHTSDDGWGVAASEALLEGCAVVLSDRVGASVIVRDNFIGRVVPACSAEAIRNAVEDIRDAGLLTETARSLRAAYASKTLTGKAGARNLLDIIEWAEGVRDERPKPYYEQSIDGS
jgi:glycosyltransferase involved in cell wall biosynthesis